MTKTFTKPCLFLTCMTLGACTIGDPLAIDGTWNLTATAGAGDCIAPGTAHASTTEVSVDGDDYLFSPDDADPDETLDGHVTCTDDHCDVSLTFTDPSTTGSGQSFVAVESYDLDITDDLAVTGTGTVTASGAVTCSQSLAVAGFIDQP